MEISVKYLILGAGPSGLAFASSLLRNGETDFLVLEKEDQPGGLCRSIYIDNSPLDLGGGHFLDVRNQKTLDFVFSFLPESEWNIFDRVSKIRNHDWEIDYPYEANIWQLPIDLQIEHILSIVRSGCNSGQKMPKSFVKWIRWKLGDVIAQNYMIPYNSKIFASHINELGTYWLNKLPNVSIEDTIRSCLLHAPYGQIPAHSQFYYPKHYGYGEIFLRMGEYIKEYLLLNTPVESIDVNELIVNKKYKASIIFNTIPWCILKTESGIPDDIRRSIKEIKYSSIDIVYHSNNLDTNAHWTYYPDEKLAYHRTLNRKNFITGSRGYWEEINSLKNIRKDNIIHHNEFAYPLNTLSKPAHMEKILGWAKEKSIIGLGRWGLWEHMNSDVAISEAILLAEKHLQS